MEFDKSNRNGRIYRKEDFFGKEFKNYYYGELDPDIFDGEIVNMIKISHVVDNVHIDEDNLVGDIKILDTPRGKIVKDILNSGHSLYIGSRGKGIIKNGIVENYELITFDIVSNGAFENAVITNEKPKYNYYINKIQKLKETWSELRKDK